MKLQNHYKDGFFDVCAEHGFLPVKDPIVSLPSTYADVQKILDEMPVVLPNGEHGLLHHDGEIMKAIEALKNHLEEVKKEDDLFVIQALFRSYGFLTSAYLLEPSFQQFRKDGTYGKARNFLPANIAQPFCYVSEKLGVFPWLDYHYAYSLGNYRKLDESKDLNWENITMCNRFSGQSDEVGFIMLHVDINRFSPQLVGSVMYTLEVVKDESKPVHDFLEANWLTMKKMNERRKEMWKASRWQHYNDFRIFIMGVKGNEEIFGEGITYEGVWDEPKAFRGQTGAQDDIIPMQDIFSGVIFHYPQNDLTKYLLDLRAYRPVCVQKFFSDLSETMEKIHPKGLLGLLKERNDIDSLCFLIGILEEIYHFRNGHWQFVQKYIMSNTKYAKATGGTPITSWIPNQIMAVIIQMEEVLETLSLYGESSNDTAQKIRERNIQLLPTKRKLLEGQLLLIHQNDFSAESVFELNKKYGYEDSEEINY
jgi:indoleamine 2,3-dioxygenase